MKIHLNSTALLVLICLILSAGTYGLFFYQKTYPTYLKLYHPSVKPNLSKETFAHHINILQHHLQQNPDDQKYMLRLARTHATLFNWEPSIALYTKLLEETPNNSELLSEKLYILIQQKQSVLSKEVIDLAQKILTIDPTQPYMLFVAGAIGYQLNDKALAKKIWSKHQKYTHPSHPNYATVKQYLKTIEAH